MIGRTLRDEFNAEGCAVGRSDLQLFASLRGVEQLIEVCFRLLCAHLHPVQGRHY